MRVILQMVAAILLTLTGHSQQITGMVKDSTGAPVPYANINLRKQTGDLVLAFTTADAKGAYILTMPTTRIDSIYLEARCIGYKPQVKTVTTATHNVDFTLAVAASQLQSIVIHNNKPRLRTHGDTVSYKAADFTETQDRVIGDVIKRLPGITVADDGTISYNNKPISGVYLSGDNLLGDKYTMATNTIPQNVVDQVQVIQNHQPIRVLENKVTSQAVALNLTFKPEAKMHVLGQETVGAGLPGNYYADGNALLLKDKYKALDDIKGNNTGEDLQRELTSHNSSDDQLRIGDIPPPTLLSLGTVNNPALQRQRYFFDRSALLNGNNLVNFNNSLQLRLNAYYLHDTEQQDYSQTTRIYLPADTVQYTATQHNRFNPDLWHAQITMTVNQDKQYGNDVLLLEQNRWQDYSRLNTNGSPINQMFLDNKTRFSNEFNSIQSIGKGHLLEGYSYLSHQTEPENLSIGQRIQQVDIPTGYTRNYLSYKIPGDLLTKSFFAGFNIQSQQLTSNLAPDSSTNNVNWHKSQEYVAAAIDLPGDRLKANLTIPITRQQIHYLHKALTRLYVNPQLYAKYGTGAENFVTLLFSYRNQTGGIEDIYPGYILKDYRTLYANNADLTLQQNLFAAAGFNYRKALKLLFASINLSYDRIAANNLATSQITNDFLQLRVLPYPNATSVWTADATISKYWFQLRTTFDGELKGQDNRSVQVQNGAVLPFSTTTGTLITGLSTKISSRINASYHLTATQIHSFSSAETATVRVTQWMQQAEIHYFPITSLQLKLSGEHYLTRSAGNPNFHCFFADASAKVRFTHPRLDFQLEATNFGNIKTYKALYLSANTFTASSYTLPGRIILLKMMFSL